MTIGFIAASVLVFIYQLSLDDFGTFAFTHRFGAIPSELLGGEQIENILVRSGFAAYRVDVATPIPVWGTVFTSMFMHGGFMHLAGNMVYLWVFGSSMESRMGSPIFAVFYLAAGVGAVFAQAVTNSSSTIPMVGASGAVAGILGAYLVLYPTSRIDTLVMVGIITSIRVPAYVLLGIWLFLQLFNPVLWHRNLLTAGGLGADIMIEFGGGLGGGETAADKRPNLEGIVKKAFRGTENQPAYFPVINARTLEETVAALG